MAWQMLECNDLIQGVSHGSVVDGYLTPLVQPIFRETVLVQKEMLTFGLRQTFVGQGGRPNFGISNKTGGAFSATILFSWLRKLKGNVNVKHRFFPPLWSSLDSELVKLTKYLVKCALAYQIRKTV